MKILHITDSHGTVKSPESRQDIYYISFLKKLYEINIAVKRLNIDMIIHTGDLFHTARVSNKFAGQVSEIIKMMNVPFYVVPGNHDIEGYSIDTLDQTTLGLLSKADVVKLLTRDTPLRFNVNNGVNDYSIAISGQEYYANIDEGNDQDFAMQQDLCDLNILAIHGYIADTPQHPNIKHTLVNSIITDADIILTGHYHRQFEWSNDSVSIYNPGSMMRVEMTEYNKTHTPQYGVLEIALNNDVIEYDYNFYDFKIAQPSSVIFDFNSKYQAKQSSITLDGFKTSISQTMSLVNPSVDIIKLIKDTCNVIQDKDVEKLSLDFYNNALINAPDDFDVKQGYISLPYSKNIKSVHLKNFQSHEDTVINFSNDVNIIIGESNSGKTSILRAIMWVIDNEPLGSDFIMAGKNSCSVKIEYDDGTSIERGRTLKDTGYYKIKYKDDAGNICENTFKGFTNAVPVEVLNIHQMPYVNITKDLETHLNVISQLDKPFLLTDSVNTKANAIGRITGTHIVDASVKLCTKEVQATKRDVKQKEELLKTKKEMLANFVNVDKMSMILNKANKLIQVFNNEYSKLKTIKEKLNELNGKNNVIISLSNDIAVYKKFVNLKNIIQFYIDECNSLYSSISYLKKASDIDNDIVYVEQQLQTCLRMKKIAPLISVFGKELNTGRYMLYVYDKAFSLNQSIAQTENDYNNKRSLIKPLKQLLDYSMLQLSIYKNASSIQFNSNNIDDLIKSTNSDIIFYKTALANKTKQLQAEQENKNNFILNNGVCPCCGQAICDKQIANINTFMEGLT